MKLRNRIRIFCCYIYTGFGYGVLTDGCMLQEVTAEESDMANDAEPDMDETLETDNSSETANASETDKETKQTYYDMEQNIPVTDIEISDHEEEVEVGKDNKPLQPQHFRRDDHGKHDNLPFI